MVCFLVILVKDFPDLRGSGVVPAAPPVHRIGDKDACVKKIDETMLKVKGMGKQLDMLPGGGTLGVVW